MPRGLKTKANPATAAAIGNAITASKVRKRLPPLPVNRAVTINGRTIRYQVILPPDALVVRERPKDTKSPVKAFLDLETPGAKTMSDAWHENGYVELLPKIPKPQWWKDYEAQSHREIPQTGWFLIDNETAKSLNGPEQHDEMPLDVVRCHIRAIAGKAGKLGWYLVGDPDPKTKICPVIGQVNFGSRLE